MTSKRPWAGWARVKMQQGTHMGSKAYLNGRRNYTWVQSRVIPDSDDRTIAEHKLEALYQATKGRADWSIRDGELHVVWGAEGRIRLRGTPVGRVSE